MTPATERWSALRAEQRWTELWSDVVGSGTDADGYRLLQEMTQSGELSDPEARAMAVDAFKPSTRGKAMHQRNVERAQAFVAAGR